jgi:hypothetical protein
MGFSRLRSPAARLASRAAAVALLSLVLTTDAHADWLITPFIGTTFGVDTGYLTLDPAASIAKHAVYGVSGGWLGTQVLGLEGEFAFVPGFFQTGDEVNLNLSSRVTTLFGNVLAAVPVSVSRDSLRPYLLGGLGLVGVTRDDQLNLVDTDDRSLGLQLGGGALGFVSDRAALRFDLRHVRTLSRTTNVFGERETKLSFWRAAIGVAIRY